MAFITVSTSSAALGKCIRYNAVIPENPNGDIPVVFLLHGLSDDYTAWQRFTAIEVFANERGIAVIMPDAGRSFYTDMKSGDNYYSSIVEDVMRSARTLFPITKDRAKTFTAGLSMGGYGAVKLALRNPDIFSACASLSGVLDIAQNVSEGTWDGLFASIWGEDYKNTVPGSRDDLFALATPELTDKVRIFMACGDEDFLLEENHAFRDHVAKVGFTHVYEEHPGNHNWHFWGRYIPDALDFLLAK